MEIFSPKIASKKNWIYKCQGLVAGLRFDVDCGLGLGLGLRLRLRLRLGLGLDIGLDIELELELELGIVLSYLALLS